MELMENEKNNEVKRMLRIAFRATFAVLKRVGQDFAPGSELDMAVANMKQDVLYNEQVVEILQEAGLDEQTAGILIDQSMNEIVQELFFEGSTQK